LTVNNNFGEIKFDKMNVNILGESKTIDTGVLEKGEHEYSVSIKKSYYDASKFIERKKVSGSLQLSFENPSIPQSEISGKPNLDGDWRTWESYEPGGDTPDLENLREGDLRYSASGVCDIQFLRDHGFDTSDCHGYAGGEATPRSTQNHVFTLEDFKSVSFDFNASVAYCGENATYVDGECQIDEDLHLRGDVCPLLQSHQIVTETFPAGTSVSADSLDPEPSFFCTKHPVLVTDSSGEQTGFNTDPYRSIVDGESVEVPEGETWTLYWTIDVNESDVSKICEEGSYNTSSGACERTPGVTHNCGQGVYNPSTGSCIVEAEAKNICDVGRFNSEFEKCQYEPDANDQCSVGYFDNATSSCLAPSNVVLECPDDAVEEDGECRVEPAVVKLTPVQDLLNSLSRIWRNFALEIVGGSLLLALLGGGIYYSLRYSGSGRSGSRFRRN